MLGEEERAQERNAESLSFFPPSERPLGLIVCGAPGAGNVIGGGFFLFPAARASAGLWILVHVLLGLPFHALILARGATKPLEEE